MPTLFAVTNLVILVLALLCASLPVVVYFTRRAAARRHDPRQVLAHMSHRLVEQTLGEPLIAALRISPDALHIHARSLTSEQRAVAASWVQHRQTRLTARQRTQLLAALRAAEPGGGN